MSASGITIMWFLAPPKHWTRLPCAVPVEKMYSAIADEPTKPIALTRGSVSSVSTASLSPLTTLSTPSGSPAWRKSSAIRSGTEGSRSDGLRMKVLPQAIAGAHLHNDAERVAHGEKVNARSGGLGEFTLHQVWNPAGELHDFEAALDVAFGIREGLAVLGGEQAGQVGVLGLGQFQGLET